jgi:hypothetical protein
MTMNDPTYFMESEGEALRLDLKTDPRAVEEQACWAVQGKEAVVSRWLNVRRS